MTNHNQHNRSDAWTPTLAAAIAFGLAVVLVIAAVVGFILARRLDLITILAIGMTTLWRIEVLHHKAQKLTRTVQWRTRR